MSKNVSGALRALLTEIVDYAGLFPPTQLSMSEAVQNYVNYSNGEYEWMLGRFIVPVTRLNEFANEATRFWSANSSKQWRISVLAKEDLAAATAQIEAFNLAHRGFAMIDALETSAESAAQIRAAKQFLSADIITYFEIPLSATLPEQVSALAAIKCRAKIRTGGVVQDAIPPIDEIVKFLRVSVAATVPFKATAGLHHPFRTAKPLTYEANAPTGTMHGFLNLFLSTAFMRQNLNSPFVHKTMADGDARNFKFDDEGVEWQGHRLEVQQLESLRKRGAISFGSCSFTEPIEDLQQLELL